MAETLGVSRQAVSAQLDHLEERGLVAANTGAPSGRGRPATQWSLTELATDLFPDRHSDLTIELIEAIRASVGDEGLAAVLAERDRSQLAEIQGRMGLRSEPAARAERLAEHRSAQGYMAEVVPDGEDLLLIEHHCPVCDAAASCQGLCAGELDLFREAMGPDLTVEREEHLLSGDERCIYRIRSATSKSRAPRT